MWFANDQSRTLFSLEQKKKKKVLRQLIQICKRQTQVLDNLVGSLHVFIILLVFW